MFCKTLMSRGLSNIPVEHLVIAWFILQPFWWPGYSLPPLHPLPPRHRSHCLSRWCSPSPRYNPPSRLSGFHVLVIWSPYCCSCGPCLRLFWCQLFKRTLSWGPTRWPRAQLPSRPWRWWMEVKEEELVGKATKIFCIEIFWAQSFLFRVYSTCVAWEALHPGSELRHLTRGEAFTRKVLQKCNASIMASLGWGPVGTKQTSFQKWDFEEETTIFPHLMLGPQRQRVGETEEVVTPPPFTLFVVFFSVCCAPFLETMIMTFIAMMIVVVVNIMILMMQLLLLMMMMMMMIATGASRGCTGCR